MEFFTDYLPFMLLGAGVLIYLFLQRRKGAIAATLGGKLEKTYGQVRCGSPILGHDIKIHKLTDGNKSSVVLEVVTRGVGAASFYTFTKIDRAQIGNLIALLEQAANET